MSKHQNIQTVDEIEEIEAVAPETDEGEGFVDLNVSEHPVGPAFDANGIEESNKEMVEEQEAELTVGQIVSFLVGKIETAKVTPYGIHTVVNSAFEVLGNPKRVRPQMMYNYDRNGILCKGKKNTKEYTKTEAIEFATKFVEKHNAAK